MSAWKCSDGHIQFVAEILKHNPQDDTEELPLDELVITLDFFNQLSLYSRYNQPIDVKPFELIEIHPTWHDSAVEKAQALACYDYQTCESPIYRTSNLVTRIRQLVKRFENQTPTMEADTGHWGIETEELTQPRKAMQH